jgi:predicted Zn-dependent protease with MMP-like domain
MAQIPPSLADIEALAARALASLPRRFKRHLGPVVIRAEDFPDAETEAAMELDSPFDLLGLYRGVALPLKSVSDPRPDIDMIFLYRRPILDYWCDTGEDLFEVVRHVLIHEIGHHFGFSDADMERIENSL